MTKADRHNKILELITNQTVSTQTELTNLLIKAGYDVTQATTSRDLQELRVMKMLLNDGTYKYTVSRENEGDISGKLRKVLEECLFEADYAGNIVVLKTLTGAAQAVAYALDMYVMEDVLGTIAGDDTVLIITKTPQKALEVKEKLTQLIK